MAKEYLMLMRPNIQFLVNKLLQYMYLLSHYTGLQLRRFCATYQIIKIGNFEEETKDIF